MSSVAAFLDALLPVLHEVAQGEQGVIAHGDPVFSRPGFHGHQDDASVELLLVDLDSSKGNPEQGLRYRKFIFYPVAWYLPINKIQDCRLNMRPTSEYNKDQKVQINENLNVCLENNGTLNGLKTAVKSKRNSGIKFSR